PMPGLRMRLPLMAELATAQRLPAACSRLARMSGQRRLAPAVAPTPSVIESPKVTMVPSALGESTSTTDRKARYCAFETGVNGLPTKLPGGETASSSTPVRWQVQGPVALGR